MASVKSYTQAILYIRYAYPVLVLSYFLLATGMTVCMLQTQSLKLRDKHVRRGIILCLIIAVIGSYVIESILLLVRSLVKPGWFGSEDHIVYLLASVIVWGIELLLLVDTRYPVWYPYYGSWLIGVNVEVLLIILSNALESPSDVFAYLQLAIGCCRVVFLLIVMSVYFTFREIRNVKHDGRAAETQPLLSKKLAPKASCAESDAQVSESYGTTADAPESETAGDVSDADTEDSYLIEIRESKKLMEKRLQEDGDWWTYLKGFFVFLPHVWPMHNRVLQFRAALVGLTLLAGNILNVLTPRQFGIATDSLVEGHGAVPWIQVSIFVAFRFINSSACLGWLKMWLWLPVEQYSYDALSTASYSHVMNLSSEFHDSKTSSEISQAVSQGRSVSDLLETICFEIFPMFIDLLFAFVYLYFAFGPYMALLTATTTLVYIYLTTKYMRMKASRRRDLISTSRKEWIVAHQGLDGWRTVSLFNNIKYEEQRYASAVKSHLDSLKSWKFTLQVMKAAQMLVLTLGLLGGSFLAVYQVTHGFKSPGSFATLLLYWTQLSTPLNFFSTMYSTLSSSMMDAERLLELFQTKPSITDSPNAKALELRGGQVSFKDVSFSYDPRKSTLQEINFEITSGLTVALVGETGSGKSTILKLIDRFYDVTSGSIEIDGQDIRDVPLMSLRDNIGVVPQDPTLFNESIMNNIRYARLRATDDEVYEACQAAAIHDKIMSFPEGYNSKVGERGIKLSGGEQQRIAIARAILKQPQIILLDEATSAVDTETESKIQEAFRKLCQNRTTIIVAHRLSTIMRADLIMVVKDGRVVESGSHDELLKSNGKYASLWSQQIFVKPTTERSRSKSPKDYDAIIVNDLSPERSTAEVAKVLKTAGKTVDKFVDETVDDQLPGKKEPKVSTLNADAPEFKMQDIQVANGFNDETEHTQSKGEEKETLKLEREKNRHDKEMNNATSKAAKHTNSKSSPDEHYKSKNEPASEQQDTQSIGGDSKTRKAGFIRRLQVKTEPSHCARHSMDGTQDLGATGAAPGAGSVAGQQVSVNQRRRVSAPSYPPNTRAVHRGPARSDKARRTRHWRLKTRAAENNTSSRGSVSAVDASSHNVSTDERRSLAAPATTPAEIGPSKDVQR